MQAPLAMGGFAVTIITLSLAMMGFRGLSVDDENLFMGDLCFVACIGLLISAQWAMYKGDTFSFTVLTAFGESHGSSRHTMISIDVCAQDYFMADMVHLCCHPLGSLRHTVERLHNTTMPWASSSCVSPTHTFLDTTLIHPSLGCLEHVLPHRDVAHEFGLYHDLRLPRVLLQP